MPIPYAHLPENVTLDPPSGGQIRSGGDAVYPAGALFGTRRGAAFGPLVLSTPTGGHLELSRLQFLPVDDDSGGILWFGSAGLVAGASASPRPNADDAAEAKEAAQDANGPVTRRTWLVLALSLIGGALASNTASAQEDDEETVTLEIAELDVSYSDAPIDLTVADAVAGVLPATTDVLVDAQNTRVGEIASVDEAVTLRPTTGTIRVYLRDSRGALAELLAWARGFLPDDESISFEREFPDDKQASDYSVDQFVRLTEHPAIVRPIQESGPDATALTIGNTPIPHVDDNGDGEAGAWDMVGGALVYEVGPSPPVSSTWSITTRLGPLQRYLQ